MRLFRNCFEYRNKVFLPLKQVVFSVKTTCFGIGNNAETTCIKVHLYTEKVKNKADYVGYSCHYFQTYIVLMLNNQSFTKKM